nr:hypothetical protein [Tanacetum cinerariifolium]
MNENKEKRPTKIELILEQSQQGVSDDVLGLIQSIASVFTSAEYMYYVRHIHETMKSQFKGGMYKEMLWNAAKATFVGEFNKKMVELKTKCDLLLNNIREVFNRKLVDGRDQPIITCLEYIIEYLMKRIVVVQKVIANTIGPLTPSVTKLFDAIKKATKKWELTGIPCKHVVAAIYNMSENSVNPCNGIEMWPVVESRTVIIPPLYKPQIGKSPKKRKKSHDEIANESCSSGKLSRNGKSVSQPITTQSTTTGARNASSQAAGASQPSAAPSTTSQGPTQHSAGPRQCFQASRPAPT